ncbi:MAG TPA: DNA-3-methyladenine glycosylase [Polyangiaceae bacterium]|nr:DNA-3-methyladenine glycosylase [Polyangiaceae bacterium]
MRLTRDFYARPVLVVARDCIGKVLVHETPAGRLRGRIVETEAYAGPEDRAAHSYGGRRTARTEVMYGPPGHVYVFFVYGMHWNFNLVTGRAGEPQAVLVRALEPLEGFAEIARRRGASKPWERMSMRERCALTNGPGKLCQAFGIDRAAYGADLETGPLYLDDGTFDGSALDAGASQGTAADGSALTRRSKPRVSRSARIGVDYAGEWALKPYRFYDAESAFVSVSRATRDRV